MIIQTTPEIAEGLFEHLLLMNIHSFEIRVSKHKIVDMKTKVFFIIHNIDEHFQDKITNLIELYNQLIPNQSTLRAGEKDIEDTQDFWTPVKDFNVTASSFVSQGNFQGGLSNLPDGRIYEIQGKIGFGIGLHPTTILALQGLEKKLSTKKKKLLVDVGSGSGILSLYARTKCVEKIIAFEVQDEAINSMKENFYRNNFDPMKIIFNPYLTKEQKDEDIRDSRQVLNSVNELIFSELLDQAKKNKDEIIFAANMRPQELSMCKDILNYADNLIISGLMNDEVFEFNKDSKNELTFGEWKGRY